jgi:TetR/AcrR family fatty acid metabolism transcriptional regulator
MLKNSKNTMRQEKALETKDKIYEVAMRKFIKKGLENTSISEICQEAGVSVGSFYTHFENKEGVIYETFRRADLTFEHFLQDDRKNQNLYELIQEYMDYYISFVLTHELEFLKRFYNTGNHFFVKGKRPMQDVLKTILKNRNPKLNEYYVKDSDELVDLLFMTSRGIIFHWCLKERGFDLQEVSRKQIEMVLKSVLLDME